MLVYNCGNCDYKSNHRWCVRRHSSNNHKTHTPNGSQPFPLRQPSQQLSNINVPMQVPIGSGQNEVAYSDEDTSSEHSSDVNQYDFFDADSDSENNTTEPSEGLDNAVDDLDDICS